MTGHGRRLAPALALMLACLVQPAPSGLADSAATRPVMVGGHGDLDACLSTSTVARLRPGGDGYLSVRAGPGTRAAEVGRLRMGHVVWSCDNTPDDAWTGIVFDPANPGEDFACDLGPNRGPRRAYRGKCRSGWVATRYLVLLAS